MKQKYKIVAILWDDAETSDGWEDIAEFYKPAEITSIGMLIYEDEQVYVVASSADDKICAGKMVIPKKMVKQYKELRPT